MYLALVKLRVPDAALRPAENYRELEPEERKLMHDFERRRQAALWSYLIWGSPLGWVIAPLLVAIDRLINPAGSLAKAGGALPWLTDQAVLGAEQGSNAATVDWVRGTRHLSAQQR
jgi:hypothetical protein